MFQSVINKRWLVLLAEEKLELTTLLYKHLLARHAEFPHFIRNKLLKLIVDIARYDWPHFYPDFFMNICKVTDRPLLLSKQIKPIRYIKPYNYHTLQMILCLNVVCNTESNNKRL